MKNMYIENKLQKWLNHKIIINIYMIGVSLIIES